LRTTGENITLCNI